MLKQVYYLRSSDSGYCSSIILSMNIEELNLEPTHNYQRIIFTQVFLDFICLYRKTKNFNTIYIVQTQYLNDVVSSLSTVIIKTKFTDKKSNFTSTKCSQSTYVRVSALLSNFCRT